MTWCCFHFNNLLLILQIQHSSKHRIHHLPCKIVHPSFLYKYPNLKSQCYFWVFYIASKSSSFPQWSLNLSQAGFRSGFFTFGHLGQPTFQPLPPAAIHWPPIHFPHYHQLKLSSSLLTSLYYSAQKVFDSNSTFLINKIQTFSFSKSDLHYYSSLCEPKGLAKMIHSLCLLKYALHFPTA